MNLPTWNRLIKGIAPASSSGIAIERVVGVLQETTIMVTIIGKLTIKLWTASANTYIKNIGKERVRVGVGFCKLN